MYNMFEFTLLPQFVHANEKPPTIYALLNSIVNFGKPDTEKVKIKDLAKAGHAKIFDFDYPLTTNIKKEDFEVMILNKFLMRRIGFQTLTPFQIQLNVKLNEIMPLYNKMFDALENWNIFNDGETVTRTQDETRKSNLNNTSNNNIEETPPIKEDIIILIRLLFLFNIIEVPSIIIKSIITLNKKNKSIYIFIY